MVNLDSGIERRWREDASGALNDGLGKRRTDLRAVLGCVGLSRKMEPRVARALARLVLLTLGYGV